jgi:hypothetical protein
MSPLLSVLQGLPDESPCHLSLPLKRAPWALPWALSLQTHFLCCCQMPLGRLTCFLLAFAQFAGPFPTSCYVLFSRVWCLFSPDSSVLWGFHASAPLLLLFPLPRLAFLFPTLLPTAHCPLPGKLLLVLQNPLQEFHLLCFVFHHPE